MSDWTDLPPERWPRDLAEEWAERSAIIECSCKVSRAVADEKARRIVIERFRKTQEAKP